MGSRRGSGDGGGFRAPPGLAWFDLLGSTGRPRHARSRLALEISNILPKRKCTHTQTDDQGSGPRDVPRRGSSSSDGAKDVDVAVPPEIEKQVRVSIECMNVLRLVWMDQALWTD